MYAAAARPFSSLSNTLLAAAVVDKEDIARMILCLLHLRNALLICFDEKVMPCLGITLERAGRSFMN